MTWGEIKLVTVQRMFSNESPNLVADDGNKEYLDAAPGAANEGLQIICSVGRPIKKKLDIELTPDATEPELLDGTVKLPLKDGIRFVILTDYAPDFRALLTTEIYFTDGTDYGKTDRWDMQGDDVLLLDGQTAGTYTVWYEAYPPIIDQSTPDDFKLPLAPEAVRLLPLYMASQLYKEDDIGMATDFRNEFEDGLAKLRETVIRMNGPTEGRVGNTTGWW